jgi:hypothetical protein
MPQRGVGVMSAMARLAHARPQNPANPGSRKAHHLFGKGKEGIRCRDEGIRPATRSQN